MIMTIASLLLEKSERVIMTITSSPGKERDGGHGHTVPSSRNGGDGYHDHIKPSFGKE